MMSSRKALFHVINEMCNEMRRKLDNDWEHICVDRWTVGWQILKDQDQDDNDCKMINKQPAKAMSKAVRDEEDERSFNFYSKAGFCVGITDLRIETSYEKYKNIKIIELHSVVEGKHTVLRTNINWYDRLRPTFWKLNRTIKYARRLRTTNHAFRLEKDLAKMIPDRVDNILLGGTNAKT